MFEDLLHPRRYTAREFYVAMEPLRLARMRNCDSVLADLARKAHAIAVINGFDWNSEGRYPMAVWTECFC